MEDVSTDPNQTDLDPTHDPEWIPDGEGAPKKKGPWKWIFLGCGCGCLIVVIVVAILAFTAVKSFSGPLEPEEAWRKLDLVLPFEEQPANLDMQQALDMEIFGFEIMEQYAMVDRGRGLIVNVYRLNQEGKEEFLRVRGGGFQNVGQPKDGEPVLVMIQGRECAGLAFDEVVGEDFAEDLADTEGEVLGPGLRVDISGDEDIKGVILELRRLGSGDSIPLELAEEILEPFDVWALR